MLQTKHGDHGSSSQNDHFNKRQAELIDYAKALVPRYLVLLGCAATDRKESDPWVQDGVPKSPSCFVQNFKDSRILVELGAVEAELRSKRCLQALQKLHTACSLKALMLKGKKTSSSGQKSSTRAQSLLATQTQQIALAAWCYNNSQVAYNKLLVAGTTEAGYPILSQSDINSFVKILVGDRTQFGEGHWVVPWFCRPPWTLKGLLSDNDISTNEGR
jgi:hypothetical protein